MIQTIRLLVSLGTAVLLACEMITTAVVGSTRSTAAAAERPNIIFVLTDDQFPGTENAMPALNSNVTSRGVEFTNMISTYPLCCPGRATILRGQYPHNTRIFSNSLSGGGWEKFEARGEHKSTVATWLDDAGYQTGLFGKYMNNYTDAAIPPGWDRWYAWNGPEQGWSALNDQGVQKPQIRSDADSNTSTAALKYLGNHLDRSAPVFAWVSFGAEHEPYYYDQADAAAFADFGVPRTPSFNEDDVSDKPSGLRDLPPLSEAGIATMDQDYRNGLRSLMRVDRFIGDASDLLRSKGEMDNTYFVFYTDNGAHFGQHRFAHGKLEPYQEDTNFPLIVRGPGLPQGVTNNDLVGNHDIASTMARMGGANVPSFVDGRSFLPLARNPSASWSRTAILSERETGPVQSGRWDLLRMPGRTYTLRGTGEKEYYDLISDPGQIHNAFSTSATDPARYPRPHATTRTYYNQRLGDLEACSGHGNGPGSCLVAENAPPRPAGTSR